MTESETPILRLVNISKSFPGVKANNHISLSICRGEIHALLGENGAGKTTLMNIVYGLLHADEGEIYLNGKLLKINSPKDAIEHRIGMVHQHFMLEPTLTVTENIILGMQPLQTLLTDIHRYEQEIEKVAHQSKLQIDPSVLVSKLSVGEQQRVEIVKALYKGVDLLILDEPTAVLTPQETHELFQILKELTTQGLSIIFITHKLNEVMEVADRVSVLRDGRLTCTRNVQETDLNELAFMMVDRKVNFETYRPPRAAGEPVLEAVNLTVKRQGGRAAVDHVSLTVHAGEILGIAGVDGNGQKELVLAITGLVQPDGGKILLNGKDMTHRHVQQFIEAGMGHIPEDRHFMGLMLDFPVDDNLLLQNYNRPPFVRAGLLDRNVISEHARRLVAMYDIKTRSIKTKVSHLSGGNQQRVIVGREMDRCPNLLIAVQPTRGLDIGATEYIHKKLVEQRTAGAAILLVSTELHEILALSDRICVIYEGRIIGELPNTGEDILRIGRLMAGVADS